MITRATPLDVRIAWKLGRFKTSRFIMLGAQMLSRIYSSGFMTEVRRVRPAVIILTALLFVVAPVVHSDAVAPRRVALSASDCMTPPDNYVRDLWPLFRPVVDYSQICHVLDEKKHVALSILIVRFDRLEAENFFDRFPDVYIPHPFILDKYDRKLGELKEGFPVQLPGMLRVTFVDWRQGFPWRIELYEAGISASQPHALPPMLWDPISQTFR